MNASERRAARRAARAQRRAERQNAMSNRRNTRQEQRTQRAGARARAREVAYQSGIDPRSFIGESISSAGQAAAAMSKSGLFNRKGGDPLGMNKDTSLTANADNKGLFLILAAAAVYFLNK